MVKSMTAFGRSVLQTEEKTITVEIKSVNNRFLDLNIRLPKIYSPLEEKIRNAVTDAGIKRGKIDITIAYQVNLSSDVEVFLDKGYAESYIKALYDLRDSFNLTDDITTMRVATNKDIFTTRQSDEDLDKLWIELSPIVDKALKEFNNARAAEGERLKEDLISKKNTIKSYVSKIKELSQADISGYKDKLEARLRQTLDGLDIVVDEARILTEVAIFTDKVAIDEELVRLDSHFKAFDEIFKLNEPIGRKIDFLLQEMNREVNTTGSKCSNAQIAHIVVDIKAELEKIREQIQNIE